MKKILFLILAAFCSYTYTYGQDITGAANLKKYAEANAKLTKKVIFLGNSITEGWVKARPDFFDSNNYVGRGISGQTSPQLLLRFRQDVINLSPVAVVINIGTNDIARNTGAYDPQFTMDCIQSMAELARYNGIKVILTSVLPVGEYPWKKEITNVPQIIDELNGRIKRFAEASGFTYVDYNAPMRDANGGMKEGLASDGVHPTEEGYKMMEGIIKEVIDRVIEF